MSIVTIGAIGARGNAGVQSLNAGSIALTPGDGSYTVTQQSAPSGGTGSYTVTLYESTTSGQLGSLIATDPTYPYQRSGRTNDTTYYVTRRVSDGVSTVDSVQVSVTPEAPSALHPNEPAGMTLIGENDGSVISSGGSAFGIPGFGAWSGFSGGGAANISLVSQPDNPTGSGQALRFFWSGSTGESAVAFLNTANNWKRFYVSYYMVYEPGWVPTHKVYYLAPFDDPGRCYISREGSQRLRITDALDNTQLTASSNLFPDDTIVHVESLWTAESAAGAGDGRFQMWVDGNPEIDLNPMVMTQGGAADWRVLEWYARANDWTPPDDCFYRVLGLRISASQSRT